MGKNIIIAVLIAIILIAGILTIKTIRQKNQSIRDQYNEAQLVIDSLNADLLTTKQQAAKFCIEKEIAEKLAGESKLKQIKINEYYDKIIGDIDNWDAAALDSFFAVEGRQEN
jgi:uncharacterized protein HemX